MRAVLAAIFALLAVPAFAADVAVSLSSGTTPDYANQLNDSNLEVARFQLSSTGAGGVSIDDVTLHFTSPTTADEAFSAIRLYFDADDNGTLDITEQVGTDQVPNGVDDFVTFTGTFNVGSSLIRDLYVQVDVANDPAAYGEAYTFRVDAASSLTLTNGSDTVSGAFPVTANTLTIRHSENEIVPGSGNPAAPRTAYFNASNQAALHFIVTSLLPTPPGQLSGIDLNSITISVTVGNSSQTGVVTRVSLWQDDGDSSFEPGSGEVLIQDRTPADVGSWTIAGSVIDVTFAGSAIQLLSDIPSGGVKSLWVGIDFGDGPPSVCEVAVSRTNVVGSLGVDADFFVTSTTTVSGDVITIEEKPAKEKPLEAQGEGGCSTGDRPSNYTFVLALAVIALMALSRMRRGKEIRLDSTD